MEQNKKAIGERGWCPLNFVLLDHPELKKSQDSINRLMVAYRHLELTGNAPISPADLNTSNGMAGTLMEKLQIARDMRGQEMWIFVTIPLHVPTVPTKRQKMHQGLWQGSLCLWGIMSLEQLPLKWSTCVLKQRGRRKLKQLKKRGRGGQVEAKGVSSASKGGSKLEPVEDQDNGELVHVPW